MHSKSENQTAAGAISSEVPEASPAGRGPIHSDFRRLQGRTLQRLFIHALDADGIIDLTKGDIELMLDNGGTFRISYDSDGLELFSGWADHPPYSSLAEWIAERRELGVVVRVELPESDLRRALYGSTIERVEMESDTNTGQGPTQLRLVTEHVTIDIGERAAVCSIAFDVNGQSEVPISS